MRYLAIFITAPVTVRAGVLAPARGPPYRKSRVPAETFRRGGTMNDF
jgi:hypothetical protein